MYKQQNLLYILTILECIEKAFLYTKDFQTSQELFEYEDQLNLNAVATMVLAIGEESKKIEDQIKKDYAQIPWAAIAGIRNRMAHDYRGIDASVVFDIVKISLAPLKTVLIDALSKTEYPEEIINVALDSKFYKHLQYLKK
jgi:uncharacterized protein with HEPN domain